MIKKSHFDIKNEKVNECKLIHLFLCICSHDTKHTISFKCVHFAATAYFFIYIKRLSVVIVGSQQQNHSNKLKATKWSQCCRLAVFWNSSWNSQASCECQLGWDSQGWGWICWSLYHGQACDLKPIIKIICVSRFGWVRMLSNVWIRWIKLSEQSSKNISERRKKSFQHVSEEKLRSEFGMCIKDVSS